jgi:hypothetical protein
MICGQITMPNVLLLIFDWFAIRFRISDLGYSSSAFRYIMGGPRFCPQFPLRSADASRVGARCSIMSEHVYKTYPNLYYDVNAEPWHYEIAEGLFSLPFAPSCFSAARIQHRAGSRAHDAGCLFCAQRC